MELYKKKSIDSRSQIKNELETRYLEYLEKKEKRRSEHMREYFKQKRRLYN